MPLSVLGLRSGAVLVELFSSLNSAVVTKLCLFSWSPKSVYTALTDVGPPTGGKFPQFRKVHS